MGVHVVHRLTAPRQLFQTLALLSALVFGATCGDRSSTVAPDHVTPGRASFSVSPAFATAPPGAPVVLLSRITGILISDAGDSTVVDTRFSGDSAVLSFDVQFSGISATFELDIIAYDTHDVVAYRSKQRITVQSGNNASVPPPQLVYAAPDAEVTTLHITPGPLQLNAGGKGTLGVTGTGANGAAISPIRVGWVSRDPSVATVDDSGVVQAGPSQGATYIVARTATNVADSVTVKVKAPVAKVTVSPATAEIIRGQSVSATAELRDAADHLIDDRTPVWSSSDASVATVSPAGLIQAVKIGSATITATAEGKTATTAVTVVSPIDHVVLSPPTITLPTIGASVSLVTQLVARSGASIDGISPSYSSSAPTVATVDAKGIVTAVGNGSATITATADGMTATAVITVKQLAASVAITPKSASTSSIGGSTTFTAVALDSLGNRIQNTQFTWTSSDTTIATVAGGVAVAKRAGSVTITATADGKSDAATFSVAPIARFLVITSDRAQLLIGQTAVLQAKFADNNGNTLGAATAIFSTTTPGVDSLAGNLVFARALGVAHIVATSGNLTGALDIPVIVSPNSITGSIVDAGHGNAPIVGATITAPNLGSATSGTDGTFTLGGVPSGTTLSVSAPGHVSTQYFNVTLLPGTGATSLGIIPLAPAGSPGSALRGSVIDATNDSIGGTLAGVKVTLVPGINAPPGQGDTATTDVEGIYQFVGIPAGTYTVSAAPSGFARGSATAVSLPNTFNDDQNIVVVPTSGLRITVTWGADPQDLDSYLFGPTATPGTEFRTFYGTPNGPDGERFDLDATNGFGPENTTVPTQFAGTYRFYLMHTFGSGSMAGSGATVTVRRNGVIIGTFHPPARPNEIDGDIWEVFTLSGSTITAVNAFVPESVEPIGFFSGSEGQERIKPRRPQSGIRRPVRRP